MPRAHTGRRVRLARCLALVVLFSLLQLVALTPQPADALPPLEPPDPVDVITLYDPDFKTRAIAVTATPEPVLVNTPFLRRPYNLDLDTNQDGVSPAPAYRHFDLRVFFDHDQPTYGPRGAGYSIKIFTGDEHAATDYDGDDQGRNWYNGHPGYDIGTGDDELDILAPASGQFDAVYVEHCSAAANCNGGIDNVVRLSHDLNGDGTADFYTQYHHLARFGPRLRDSRGVTQTTGIWQESDRIRAGEPIGRAGNTGRSSGAHIHFEVQRAGQRRSPVDPFGWWGWVNGQPTTDPWADTARSAWLWLAGPTRASAAPGAAAVTDDRDYSFQKFMPLGRRSEWHFVQVGGAVNGEVWWSSAIEGEVARIGNTPAKWTNWAVWGLHVPGLDTNTDRQMEPARYFIEVRIPDLPSGTPQRTSAARYRIRYLDRQGQAHEVTTDPVDQRSSNQWVRLQPSGRSNADLELQPGASALVLLTDVVAGQAGRAVVFDAVRLVLAGSSSTAPPPRTLGNLALVVDDTTSMYQAGKLDALRQQLHLLMDQLIQSRLSFSFDLIPFANQIVWNKVSSTDDPDLVKTWINSLDPGADEGSNTDCAENSLAGVIEAAQGSTQGRVLLVTDDIPLNSTQLLPQALIQLLLHRKKLDTILYPSSCTGQSGAEPYYQLYRLATRLTGGLSFRIPPSDTQKALDKLLSEAKAQSQVAFVSGQLTTSGAQPATPMGSIQYSVPLDGTVSKANFLVSVASGSLAVQLYYPNGNLVRSTDPGVTRTDFSGTQYIEIVNPSSGQWRIVIDGSGDYVFSVSAESSLDFRRLAPNVTGLGQETLISAYLNGSITSAAFELLRENGAVARSIQLSDTGTGIDAEAGDSIFSGLVSLTEPGDFRLRVTGATSAGQTFTRIDSAPIHVQGLSILAPPSGAGARGSMVDYSFGVVNGGDDSLTVQVTGSTDNGWIVTGLPRTLTLGPRSRTDVSISVTIPSDAIVGTLDEVTVVATRLETQTQLPAEVAFDSTRTQALGVDDRPASPISPGSWTQVNTNGFDDAGNRGAHTIVFGNFLYAATWNTETGAQVWRTSNAATWSRANADGFGDSSNFGVLSMAVLDNRLYAGTYNWDGAQIWRTSDGTSWTQVNANGFGTGDLGAESMSVFDSCLYVGTRNDGAGGNIWRTCDGTGWARVAQAFGASSNAMIHRLASFNGALYAGTYNPNGSQLWRSTTGANWTQIASPGFGDSANQKPSGMGVFGNALYVGMDKPVGGGEVWRTNDGTSWTQVNVDGFGDGRYNSVGPLVAFDGKLYSGINSPDLGARVYATSNGTDWQQVNTDGFGDSGAPDIWSMATWNGQLYAGAWNANGAQVWRYNNPTAPPSGSGQIIFSSDRGGNPLDLYLMNEDGTNVQRLTNAPGYNEDAEVAPERRRVVFASTRTGTYQAYIIEIDGGNVRQLTTSCQSSASPSWSPDGMRIVFECDNRLAFINPDGTQLVKTNIVGGFPSWSPDGTKIAFTRWMDADGDNEIFVIYSDGSHETRLTRSPQAEWHPAWSPDSRKLVFCYSEDGAHCAVYTINADGSDRRRISDATQRTSSVPRWSPDGLQIVFKTDRDGNEELYTMNTDGTDQRRLTNDPSRDDYPFWFGTSSVVRTCDGLLITPYFTTYYGNAALNNQPVASGDVVEAFSPRGDRVGCFEVTSAGVYGYMRVYGEDTSANPPIPGLRANEEVTFKVNGLPARSSTCPVRWQDDKALHSLDLNAPGECPREQRLSLHRGWNWISLNRHPVSMDVANVLTSLGGHYDLVLGEEGTFAPPPADPRFNTLTRFTDGKGYQVRLTQDATLTVTGDTVSPTTALFLPRGWRWLGYLPEASRDVAGALASISGQFNLLLGETGTYAPPPADPRFNTLQTMGPSQGYLIRMSQDGTLVYPGVLAKAEQVDIDTSTAQERKNTQGACQVSTTPYFTQFYGDVLIDGQLAPIDALVEAFSPRGDRVGCFEVSNTGLYGYMRLYGEDTSANPSIPGMRAGERVSLRVNGQPAQMSGDTTWQDDKTTHRVDLSVSTATQTPTPTVTASPVPGPTSTPTRLPTATITPTPSLTATPLSTLPASATPTAVSLDQHIYLPALMRHYWTEAKKER